MSAWTGGPGPTPRWPSWGPSQVPATCRSSNAHAEDLHVDTDGQADGRPARPPFQAGASRAEVRRPLPPLATQGTATAVLSLVSLPSRERCRMIPAAEAASPPSGPPTTALPPTPGWIGTGGVAWGAGLPHQQAGRVLPTRLARLVGPPRAGKGTLWLAHTSVRSYAGFTGGRGVPGGWWEVVLDAW